jgi:hypothetical protein
MLARHPSSHLPATAEELSGAPHKEKLIFGGVFG